MPNPVKALVFIMIRNRLDWPIFKPKLQAAEPF